MNEMDMKRLAAQVSVQHGIRVDPDDPIMAVVTLSRLVLEHTTVDMVEQVRLAMLEFEEAAKKVQVRAGSVVAQEVRAYTAALRHDLTTELSKGAWRRPAGTDAAASAGSRSAIARWFATGLVVALILFGCGVWVGILLR